MIETACQLHGEYDPIILSRSFETFLYIAYMSNRISKMLGEASQDDCRKILSLRPQMYYVDVENASNSAHRKVVENILMLSDYQLITRPEKAQRYIFDLDSLLSLSEADAAKYSAVV